MSNIFDRLRVVVAEFDPGANAAERTVAAHGLKRFVPDNSIIVGGHVDVLETLTSNAGTDAATLALSIEGADDLIAAIAISDASNVWDAGLRGILPGNYALDGAALTAIAMAAALAGSFIKTTASREVTVTVAVEALDTSAGKLKIFIFYLPSE